MKQYSRILFVLLIAVMLIFTGCEDIVTTENNEQTTPSQFLNLKVGEAENITFEYTVIQNKTEDKDLYSFYKMGEKFAAVFTAKDVNNNIVNVRELEMDGRVFYIMEETKMIKGYLVPVEDYFLYEMMAAADTALINSYEKEGFYIYEYNLPFAQDEVIKLNYRFFMKDNVLIKLEYSIDGSLTKTYEFTKFSQEVNDEKVFEYPADGYDEEWYSYPYTKEYMPPWWENGGIKND